MLQNKGEELRKTNKQLLEGMRLAEHGRGAALGILRDMRSTLLHGGSVNEELVEKISHVKEELVVSAPRGGTVDSQRSG